MTTSDPAVPSAGRLSRWGKIVLVTFAAYGLAVILPDTLRPLLTEENVQSAPAVFRRFYPLGTLGFQADNDGKVISVDAGRDCHDWIAALPRSGASESGHGEPKASVAKAGARCPAWIEGVREGDQVDLKSHATSRRAINGLVFVAPKRLVGLDIAMGLDVDYTRATGNRTRELELMPVAEMLSGWERVWLLVAQLSAVVVFIGFCGYLVWHHPTAETWGLFLYSVWFNSGQYFVWYANLPERGLAVFDVLQCIAQALGLVGLLIFALHFPLDSVSGWRRACQPWLVLPFLALLAAGLWGFCNFFFGWPTETAYRLYYYLTYGVYLAIAFLFWDTYRTQPAERPRIRWVILGAAWGLLCFLIADTYEATSMVEMLNTLLGIRIPPLPQSALDFLYMMNVCFPATVFYAIRHHRVIKVRIAVTRGSVLMIALAVSFIIVGFLDRKMEHLVRAYMVYMPQYLEGLVLALLWLTLFLFRERLYDILESVLARKWHAAERRLEALVDRLEEPHGIRRDEVNRALTEEPAQALDLTSAALFRRRDDGAFELEYGIRWPAHVIGALHAAHPVVTALANEPKPLRGAEWGAERLFPELEEPALAAPVVVDHVVTRIAIYGPHTTGEDLDRDEVRVLRHLCRGAAVAYAHLEAEDLRREVEELRSRLRSDPTGDPTRGGAPTR